jgi:hypothetical protein
MVVPFEPPYENVIQSRACECMVGSFKLEPSHDVIIRYTLTIQSTKFPK